jgi:hypothetical protein
MSKRDSYPPRSSSIGRVPGKSNLTPAAEPLSAHPLLAPLHSQPIDVQGLTPAPKSSQRYVPYTPRQRTVPPQATVTTSPLQTQSTQAQSHNHSPSQGHGAATSRLQLMNLKAAAQGLGLDMGSVGWAILERLAGFGTPGGGDEGWGEVWNAVVTGKVRLLVYFY